MSDGLPGRCWLADQPAQRAPDASTFAIHFAVVDIPLGKSTVRSHPNSRFASSLLNTLIGTSNGRAGRYRHSTWCPTACSIIPINSLRLVLRPELILKTLCAPV